MCTNRGDSRTVHGTRPHKEPTVHEELVTVGDQREMQYGFGPSDKRVRPGCQNELRLYNV